MLTSVRSLMAATVLAGSALIATPAMAQDDESGISVSGNVALVTDYRFRGVGLSNGDPAIQAGIDLALPAGFYVGTWGSSLGTSDTSVTLDDGLGNLADYDVGGFGGTELNFYGGWSSDVAEGVSVDIGVLYYFYPDAINRDAMMAFAPPSPTGYPTFAGYADYDTDILEFYGSVSPTLGPVGLTFGLAYAPKQDSLGGTDNLYLYTDAGVEIPGTPISLSAHLGYTDGALTYTANGKAFDWSVGASATVLGGLTIGVSYVGVEDGGLNISGVTDDTIVGTLSYSF